MLDWLIAPLAEESLQSPIRYAVPVFIILILVEMIASWRSRRPERYETRDAATSLLTGTGSVILGGLLAFIAVGAVTFFYEHRLATIPTSVATLLLCFVLDDLAYYWSHRFSHRVRWFWGNHVVHHSSQYFNLTTALRQSWFSNAAGIFLFKVPLVVVGFHPLAIIFVASFNTIYQFWIHTEAIERMPRWFEAVFNTPSHHRVHHANNPDYLDRNYAGTLIIWDKIFGTFVAENVADPPRFGLVKNIGSFNPLRVATHEFIDMVRDQLRSGLTFRQRLSYLLQPPGWSHDGSRMTSDQIRELAAPRKLADTQQTKGDYVDEQA